MFLYYKKCSYINIRNKKITFLKKCSYIEPCTRYIINNVFNVMRRKVYNLHYLFDSAMHRAYKVTLYV